MTGLGHILPYSLKNVLHLYSNFKRMAGEVPMKSSFTEIATYLLYSTSYCTALFIYRTIIYKDTRTKCRLYCMVFDKVYRLEIQLVNSHVGIIDPAL
jgi:hypothetical protein